MFNIPKIWRVTLATYREDQPTLKDLAGKTLFEHKQGDFYIKTPDHVLPFHREILRLHSDFFVNYFSKHPTALDISIQNHYNHFQIFWFRELIYTKKLSWMILIYYLLT